MTLVLRTSIDFRCGTPEKDLTAMWSSIVSDSEMTRVARLTGRKLPLSRAFWQKQAERAVMNYMFREAALPPGNRLAVDRLSDDTVLVAREWKDA